jgi:alpha-galactosidase/6-phospho-beta-glucosidase family protein
VKLAILGGGGVRMPAFIRAVLASRPGAFHEICLFEPDPGRQETTCRLSIVVAAALGHPDVVTVTADAAEAFTGADYVFSAIRVGGDRGRVIDEEVALRRGIVGQETTGPGGCAMALRTIPVVLSYCELLSRCSPGAVLINFTNPAGLITQAISAQGKVRAVGVCDTPGGTVERLAEFLGADGGSVSAAYGGLNHLGWVCSLQVGGQERMGELLARFEDLQRFDHRFAAFDPAVVRRVGAIPTEYVYYFYDGRRYLDEVARAGSSRGQDVLRLNAELLAGLQRAFVDSSVDTAWSVYDTLLGVRRDTYMQTDMQGDSGQGEARARRAAHPAAGLAGARVGGYEGLALRVIDGLSGGAPRELIVNTRNDGGAGPGQRPSQPPPPGDDAAGRPSQPPPGAAGPGGRTLQAPPLAAGPGGRLPQTPPLGLDFLGPDDVVEVRARVSGDGVWPLPGPRLPLSSQALVAQVKEYERGVVEAAMTGDAGLAGVALSQHPLVPGITAARELIADYRAAHGRHLDYLR